MYDVSALYFYDFISTNKFVSYRVGYDMFFVKSQ